MVIERLVPRRGRRTSSPGLIPGLATVFGAACLASLLVALIGSIPATATQDRASDAHGQCRLTFRVDVSAPRPHSPSVRAYRSSQGTASCTGHLGPWVTGGETGWASSLGTVTQLERRCLAHTPPAYRHR